MCGTQMTAANHPALLLVDTISSLGSIDYRHDEWGVDVTVSGSQKGLMLPPGLGFNAISDKALAARAPARLPKPYWDWEPMIRDNARTATSPTRRRPTCSTACAKRCRCCSTKGCRAYSRATRAMAKRRAAP